MNNEHGMELDVLPLYVANAGIYSLRTNEAVVGSVPAICVVKQYLTVKLIVAFFAAGICFTSMPNI